MKAILVVAIALLLMPIAATAQTVRWGPYQHPKSDVERRFNMLYLKGVVDGLLAYDVSSSEKLFCVPSKLAVTAEQADDMLRRTAQQLSVTDDMIIAVVLLQALQDTFPCSK